MKTLSMFALAVGALLVAPACNKTSEAKGNAPAAVAPVTAGTVAPTGERKVPVQVTSKGYAPGRIEAKPGEKLVLVFTRTDEHAGCASEVRVNGGPLKALPMNQAVEIPVTAPASGTITFACSMDGCHTGVVVAS